MAARIPELITLVAIVISMVFSMLILPRFEKNESNSRKNNWTIIDREFIDFQEECNG